jgi:hypothetical protein
MKSSSVVTLSQYREIFCGDDEILRMFTVLDDNNILIESFRQDLMHRYDFLKKNESLGTLPFELIEMVIDYSKHGNLEGLNHLEYSD